MKKLSFFIVLTVCFFTLFSCGGEVEEFLFDNDYEALMDGIKYRTLEEAVAAFNEKECGTVSNPKNYTIEVCKSTCNVAVNTMIIKQMPGRTLTVKSENSLKKSVIIPDYPSSTNVKENKTNALFCISGLSEFTGGSVTIKNLVFDMTKQKIENSSTGWRIFAVYALEGQAKSNPDELFPAEPGYTETTGVHRYAHNILIESCDFEGPGGKYASAFGANQNGCSPSEITIKNCSGKKLNCWFNGYLNVSRETAELYNLPYELKIENCSAEDFLCIMNSQSVCSDGEFPRVVLKNCNGSFFAQLDKDGSSLSGGTEDGVIYSCGGAFSFKKCTISSGLGKNSTENAIFKTKQGVSLVTVQQSTFSKTQGTTTTYDAWNNGGTLIVNNQSVSSFYNIND